eukprot:9715411-Ditylum_brightwellii.AAC.1
MDPPCISTHISATDIKKNYKIWKECISTSPANQHLGLYKTWVKVPEEKEEKYKGLTTNAFFTVAST